jgi:5-methylcytosine-specific restriction endonuclease McrA
MFARRPTHSARYKAHLRSPEWARIRRAALERAGYRCAFCGLSKAKLRRLGRHLEVHHNDYANLGNERPEDLTVLCAGGRGGCHALADAQRRAANGTTRAPARKRSRGRRRRRGSKARRAFTVPVGIFLFAYAGIALAGAVLPHAH